MARRGVEYRSHCARNFRDWGCSAALEATFESMWEILSVPGAERAVREARLQDESPP